MLRDHKRSKVQKNFNIKQRIFFQLGFFLLLRYELLGGCSSSPCYFGSTCIDQSNGQYMCQCPTDYSGQNCDQYTPGGSGSGSSNPCASNPCQMGSTCMGNPQTGSFQCQCPIGLTGPTCNIISIPASTSTSMPTPPPPSTTQQTFPANACNPNPCLYGGTCTPSSSFVNGYTCECLVGFIGTNCEQRQMINLCNSNSCFNGGTCQTESMQSGQYTVVCYCPPGYLFILIFKSY